VITGPEAIGALVRKVTLLPIIFFADWRQRHRRFSIVTNPANLKVPERAQVRAALDSAVERRISVSCGSLKILARMMTSWSSIDFTVALALS